MADTGDLALGGGPSSAGQNVPAAESPGRGRRRRRATLLALLGLLLALALALDLYYLLTRKPLTALLPPAVGLAKALPPVYVTSFYPVSEPMGVAVSPDAQRIYVSETGGERLTRAFDRTGLQLFSFSPPDTTFPFTRAPTYVAVDAQGQVYVVDRSRRSVSIYDQDGHYRRELKATPESPFAVPLGASFDRAGNLLITDVTGDNHTVFVVDPQGQVLRRFGGSGAGPDQLSFPNQAAVDSRGRIYVSDGNNGRLQVFGPDGRFITVFGGGDAKGSVGVPRGVTVDELDRLYVVDSGGGVVVYDVAGDQPAFLFGFGDGGSAESQMRFPQGIAVDSTGRIYVTDKRNNRVQVWSY